MPGLARGRGPLLARHRSGEIREREARHVGHHDLGSHLTFSEGLRTCPGAGISRLEQSIAWNRLLDRIEQLEYAPGNAFLPQPGIMLATLELHLRFTRST